MSPKRRLAALLTAAATLTVPLSPAAAIDVVETTPIDCPVTSLGDVAAYQGDVFIFGEAPPDGSATPPWRYLVCRVTLGGDTVWKALVTAVDATGPTSIAVGVGGVYVGWTTRNAEGWTSARVRRFGLDGVHRRTVAIETTAHVVLGDVGVAPDGRVYATGTTGGQIGDDPPEPRPLTQADAFVRGFDTALTVRWTDQFRGTIVRPESPDPRPGFARGTAITADATGIYVTGSVTGSLPGGPAQRSLDDAFVRRYGPNGNLLWSTQFDARMRAPYDPKGEVQTHPADIAVGPAGVHVAGQSQWLTDRDPSRRYDAFQRLYDRNGAVLWTREVGGWNDDGATRVMPDAVGSVLFGFAPEGLGDPGGRAVMFLARFGSAGVPESTYTFWPDAWWLRGAGIAGDGAGATLVSVAPEDPPTPTAGSEAPPPGVSLLRIDTVPPTVSQPRIQPRTGAGIGSTVPTDVSWTITEALSDVTDIDLEVSRNGEAWQSVPVASAAVRSAVVGAPLGGTIRTRVRSTDGANNTSDWSYSRVLTVALVQENSASITQSAGWTRVSTSSAVGGALDATSRAGAWARYRFVGQSIAWVGAVGPTRSLADVYLDGVRVARVNLYAASYGFRRIVFQHTWASAGTHTLEIRNLATNGRPRIDLDALLVLR